MDPAKLQRINVVGTSGSGKTTFSRALALKLDVPYLEMDRLYWLPNWTEPDEQDFLGNVAQALESPCWVLDGNYSRTQSIKWKNVQQVVWLDLPFATTLCQALKRAISRAYTKQELWPETGNRESFRKAFCSRDSIILWTIKSYKKTKRRYEQTLSNPAFRHISFIRLTSRDAIAQYLSQIQPCKSSTLSNLKPLSENRPKASFRPPCASFQSPSDATEPPPTS